MATQLATTNDNPVALTPEAERFQLRQRQSRMFAMSPLVPDHLRKGTPEQAMANCYIALTLAEAMGEVPLIVMQNIHVVNGKAGFASQYMIARANSAGIFHGRIDWRIDRSDANNLSVTAYAVLKDTGQEVSVTCDMKMAQAEGWTKNPKYKTMPEVMLRYRSAAFLVRFYAPDVMLGYQTVEEVQDVAIAAGPDLNAQPLTSAMLEHQATGEPANDGTLSDDNPTAAEGMADDDRGEETMAQRIAAGLIEQANACELAIDLRTLETDAARHRPAFEAEGLAGDVDAAIEAAKARIG